MSASIFRHAKSWLSRKGSPLLRDPEYARLVAEETERRSKHRNAAAIREAKRARLNELLYRPGADRPSRATILNIIGS